MDIAPVNQNSGVTGAKPEIAPAEAEPGANQLAGDFETFLKLLTTQMRNQDPLQPMESTEFVAQLASFSAVEQQVRANESLEKILGALGGGSVDGLAQWIGREVRAPGKGTYAGEAMQINVTPVDDTERAVLVVKNDFDQEVARRPVEPGTPQLTWDGTDDLGAPVAHGSYSFTLESYRGEELLDSQAGRVFSQVTEIRFEEGAPVLVTAGGGQVPLGELDAVR